MKIKNLILDMGNVLLHYDPDYSLNILCESKEAKSIIKKEFFGGEEWIQTDLGLITPEERFRSVSRRIPEKYLGEFKRLSDNWDICMTAMEGAHEFLSYVKESGVGLYILSNASTEFYSYFPKEIDPRLFDGIVVSSDLHLIKPDRRIYEALQEKYALIPGECLFVDDMEPNVLGARKAGWQAVQFKNDYEQIKTLLCR